MEQLHFFNPYADIRETKNRLPHWQQNGAVCFLTFRLEDSIPRHLRAQWEHERDNWLRYHPKPWAPEIDLEYHQRFTRKIEQWIDAGYGSCLLRNNDCAKIVSDSLLFFEMVRLIMISFVVMPNHVHALFVQNPDWLLEKLLQSWKRHSSLEINRLLGRAGPLWQRDYFDRLVRDEIHFANCVRYIRRNPIKAKLRPGDYVLYENELARQVPDQNAFG